MNEEADLMIRSYCVDLDKNKNNFEVKCKNCGSCDFLSSMFFKIEVINDRITNIESDLLIKCKACKLKSEFIFPGILEE